MPLQSTSRRLRSSQKLMLRLVGGLAASFVLLSALLLATGILIVPSASAQVDQEDGEAVTRVPVGEERRFIAALFGDRAVMAGTTPDFLAAARTVVISGRVVDNAVVACRTAELTGSIGGDWVVACNTATVTGTVEGDLYATCNRLTIAPEGRVLGQIYTACNELRLEGSVGQDVRVGAGSCKISGVVEGSVIAGVGRLMIAPTARIDGDLTYTTDVEIDVPAGTVTGEVTHRVPRAGSDKSGMSFAGRILSQLAFYLGTLLVSIALLFLVPSAITAPARAMDREPARAVLIGFVIALGFGGICAVASLFIAGGIPVGSIGRLIALGGFWLAPFFLAIPITALCLGDWLRTRLSGSARLPALSLAVGLFFLHVLYAIPFFGILVAIGVSAAGIGSMFLATRKGAVGPETA